MNPFLIYLHPDYVKEDTLIDPELIAIDSQKTDPNASGLITDTQGTDLPASWMQDDFVPDTDENVLLGK